MICMYILKVVLTKITMATLEVNFLKSKTHFKLVGNRMHVSCIYGTIGAGLIQLTKIFNLIFELRAKNVNQNVC